MTYLRLLYNKIFYFFPLPKMRLLVNGTAFVFVFIYLLRFPFPPSVNLDPSWMGVLSYASGHNLQFGKDVIFTYGPLSNLLVGQSVYFGQFWAPVIGGMVFYGAFTLLFFLLLKPLHYWLKGILLFLLFFYGVHSQDAQYYFLLGGGASYLLVLNEQDKDNGRFYQFLLVGLGLLFGFILLTKFSFFILGAFLTGVITATFLVRKQIQKLLLFLLPLLLAFIVGYTLQDQSWQYFPSFLAEATEVVAGYKSMSRHEKPIILTSGLALLFLNATFLVYYVRSRKTWLKSLPFLLVHAATLYICWKAGFTRADRPHVLIFFVYNLLIITVMLFVDMGVLSKNKIKLHLPLFLVGFGLLGISLIHSQPIFNRIQRNFTIIKNIFAYQKYLEQSYAQKQRKRDLPLIRDAVRNETLDVFGYEQGYAILNDFNFTPRPIFQSFCAYTPRYLKKNLYFYIHSNPQWVMFKLQTIDGRFPTLDDSQLLRHILYAYRPVLEEKGFVLFQGSDVKKATVIKPELISEQAVSLGEEISVSAFSDRPLWVQIHVKETLLGRLINFAYKLPRLNIGVEMENGKRKTYRFIPGIGEAGFWLTPLLENHFDVMDLFSGNVSKPLKKFKIFLNPDQPQIGFMDTITVRLYSLPWLNPETRVYHNDLEYF